MWKLDILCRKIGNIWFIVISAREIYDYCREQRRTVQRIVFGNLKHTRVSISWKTSLKKSPSSIFGKLTRSEPSNRISAWFRNMLSQNSISFLIALNAFLFPWQSLSAEHTLSESATISIRRFLNVLFSPRGKTCIGSDLKSEYKSNYDNIPTNGTAFSTGVNAWFYNIFIVYSTSILSPKV